MAGVFPDVLRLPRGLSGHALLHVPDQSRDGLPARALHALPPQDLVNGSGLPHAQLLPRPDLPGLSKSPIS